MDLCKAIATPHAKQTPEAPVMRGVHAQALHLLVIHERVEEVVIPVLHAGFPDGQHGIALLQSLVMVVVPITPVLLDAGHVEHDPPLALLQRTPLHPALQH